jgi:hypothetical protein
MDGGRASRFPARAREAGERRLEGHLPEVCEDENTDPSRQPCSEVLPEEK